jgi:rhodanese-related sulfurtransferase
MNTISPLDLQALLQTEPNLVVLDVRTPVEFAEVHVKEAQLVPLDQLDAKALLAAGKLSRDQPVYLLCRSGQRATKAAELFAKEGFTNPVVVTGGTLGWIEAGLCVERGESKVISLERQVRIMAGSLVLSGVLLGWFVHPGFFALPAFIGSGLIFAGITDWCGMGLLLAKAPWNQ